MDGKRGEREISVFDDPATAVLISRTGAYLRDWFEPILKRGRCCYSFRKNPKISHQSAVRDLCAWRKAHVDASAFVGEHDLYASVELCTTADFEIEFKKANWSSSTVDTDITKNYRMYSMEIFDTSSLNQLIGYIPYVGNLAGVEFNKKIEVLDL